MGLPIHQNGAKRLLPHNQSRSGLCEIETNSNLVVQLEEKTQDCLVLHYEIERKPITHGVVGGLSNTKCAQFSYTLREQKWHDMFSLGIGVVDQLSISMATL